VKSENSLDTGTVEVNAPPEVELRPVTQWQWIEYPTFQLRGGHCP